MPKNEDGEFELILGNKQLLSMFLVVVVLLGVFFVMGYIVGRNSAPLVADISRKPEGKPLTVESPVPKATAPETPPASTAPAASAPAASTPAPEKAEKAPEAAPPAKTAKVEPPKAEPAPKREPKAAEKAEKIEPAKAKAKAAAPSAPAEGATYLQLSATDKTDADKMVEVLRKNNFVALDVQVPEKPELYRVLVGPIPSGELNKTKVDLQAKGFPGNAAIPKKF